MKTARSMTAALRAARWLCLCLPWAGCAEAPFSVHSQDNDLRSLRAALDRAAPPPKADSGPPMAYVFAGAETGGPRRDRGEPATRGPGTLFGYDLGAGKLAFSLPADVRSRFVADGGVLVHKEGEATLSIRDAATGKLRAQAALPRDQVLIGVAAGGGRIYYVTQTRASVGRRSQVTALDYGGQRLWSESAPGTVGAPAVRGDVLALPYRYQDVVLLDGGTGKELSRIRQKDEEIGFVRATSAGIFYGIGARGVALLDERSVKGQRGDITYLAPTVGTNLKDRIRVFLYWDGYRTEQVDFSAFDRNRLLWEPEYNKEGGLHLRDGLAVLHSYRFLFGLDSAERSRAPSIDSAERSRAPSIDSPGAGGQGEKIRWAYAEPRHNLMAAELTQGAVVFVGQDGELGALDRVTGARIFSDRLQLPPGQQVLGASFAAATFAPQRKGEPAAVLEVLHHIIFDRDSSFIAVKTFAVQALNSLPGEQATAELIRVVTAEAMPQQVTRAAGEALVARRDYKVTAMLVQALSEHYDYLNDRHAVGVGILARAAAAMEAKEAVPALTRQLEDPTTPLGVLKEVVTALIKLGDKAAVRPLRELVLQYRSDPSFAQDPESLKLAGEGLLQVGGEAERRTVSFVAEEPRTLGPLASYYRKLLHETASKPTPPAAPAPKVKPAQ